MSTPVDYSKWNSLSISDDEVDEMDESRSAVASHLFHGKLSASMMSGGMQKCSCCFEFMNNSESRNNSPPIPTLSLPATASSTPPPQLSQKKKKSPNSMQKGAANNIAMPALALDFKNVAKPMPGMLMKMPKLPAQYTGSPIQRMQYSEAWRVHGAFFDAHPELTFNPKIHIHIKDKISDIHPIFFTDPFCFKPKRNDHDIFLEWGIQDVYDEFISFNIRRMGTQRLYGPNSMDSTDHVDCEPEVQFVNCLAYRKELEILKYRQSVKPPYVGKKKKRDTLPCDYIIEISLGFNPRVWRRLKVSSATTLSVLHDKILAPALGWVRNYHAYSFTDQLDAAMFGPVNSNAIDMMHLPSNGFVLLDDTKFYLGDLLREEGDMLCYDYDFGDHFEHEIFLLDIIPSSKSDGKVVVLDGQMSPLPEDSVGSPGFKGPTGYQELLDIWPSLTSKKKAKIQQTIAEALNYIDLPSFDPYAFDLKQCQKDLRRAFFSRASVPSGSKVVIYPTSGKENIRSSIIKRGGVYEMTRLLRGGNSFIRETVSSKRDSRSHTCCCNCGSPNNLQSCGGCRMVWYCGSECQRAQWSLHKAKCIKQTEYRRSILVKRDKLLNAEFSKK